MMVTMVTGIAGAEALVILCLGALVLWALAARADAKAAVYREFAAAFQDMVGMVSIREREVRKLEARRKWMRLCLVDPVVRDGVRLALRDADQHWGDLLRRAS